MKTARLTLEAFADALGRGAAADEEEVDPCDECVATAEDIERARAEGYAAGYVEGERAGAAEAQKSMKVAVAAAISAFAENRKAISEKLEKRCLAYTRQVFAAVLPEAARKGLAREAAAFIASFCGGRAGEGGVVVRVAPAHAAELEALVKTINGAAENFSVAADEDLDENAVELAWNDGGARLDIDGAAKEVLAKLDGILTENQGDADHERS